MSIVGKTGTGKSALLNNLIASARESGRGFALINRHSDFPGIASRLTDTSNIHASETIAGAITPPKLYLSKLFRSHPAQHIV